MITVFHYFSLTLISHVFMIDGIPSTSIFSYTNGAYTIGISLIHDLKLWQTYEHSQLEHISQSN